MPSPNDELQQYEDEYFDRRFNESVRRIFSFKTLAFVAFMFLLISSWVNAFNFYPSNWGIDVGLGISAILALAFTAWFAARQARKLSSDNDDRSGVIGTVMTGVVGSIFLAPITFNFCLGLTTAIIGVPGEQHAVEQRWRSYSRGSCDGPVIQDVWIDANIVCLDSHREHEFPAGSHITLKGKLSPLGMNVEDAVPHW